MPTVGGNATENTLKNAAIIIVIIPFMILYPMLQKYFVKGVKNVCMGEQPSSVADSYKLEGIPSKKFLINTKL